MRLKLGSCLRTSATCVTAVKSWQWFFHDLTGASHSQWREVIQNISTNTTFNLEVSHTQTQMIALTWASIMQIKTSLTTWPDGNTSYNFLFLLQRKTATDDLSIAAIRVSGLRTSSQPANIHLCTVILALIDAAVVEETWPSHAHRKKNIWHVFIFLHVKPNGRHRSDLTERTGSHAHFLL